MKRLLLCSLLLLAGLASAKLTKAEWGTSPAAPLYVGQPYDLTLTLETDENESVTHLQLSDEANFPPEESETTVEQGRRKTTFRWPRVETKEGRTELPSVLVTARVMRTIQMGYGSMSTGGDTRIRVPAFAYEVIPLPPEAEGAPLGIFLQSLAVENPRFTPGDVRELTLTIQAREGVLPETLAPELNPVEGVRIYPFRTLSLSPTLAVFKAYVVLSAESPVTFTLPPMRVFDLASRQVRDLPVTPLTLSPLTAEEQAAEDLAAASQRPAVGQPLHFAPAEKSPVIGVMGESWTVEETSGEWSRVRSGSAQGWIRAVLLKEATP